MNDCANMARRYEREIPKGYEARIEGNKVIIELIEPKETEDERIRIALVEYFAPPVPFTAVRGMPIQKIRDWLEKQKESEKDAETRWENDTLVVDCSKQKPAECSKDALIEWAKSVLKCQEEELAKYDDGPSYKKASTMGRIDAYKVLIAKLNSL